MHKLRSFALASLSLSVAVAAFVACSSDDTIITNVEPDASPDSPSNPDTGVVDSGAPDVKPDVTPPKDVHEFAVQVASALCSSLTRCCFGNGNVADGGAVDGGTYNGDKCENLYRDIGFEFSSTGAALVDGGEAVVDNDRSVACLQTVANLPCSITGAEMAAARKACFEALVGTRTAGQPCAASIECAKGNFCNPADGTCTALRGDGGACSVFTGGADEVDSVKDEEACSWRGSGDTNLRCASYDFGTLQYLPRDQWTCQPQVSQDAGCNSTVWCKDAICDPFNGYFCTSPDEIFTGYCGRVLN